MGPNDKPLFFIAGPCALESPALLRQITIFLKDIFEQKSRSFVLKCSYDKANRSSIKSYRGKGFREGLKILGEIKKEFKVELLVDVHEPSQAEPAAEVADILQIPAFLCRQTDLIIACARTAKSINVKKGQFLSPWDMKNIVEKIESTGNHQIFLTERGTCFGYGNLVVDMRGLEIMKSFGYPVIFDCTHSVQLPGALGVASGGQREFVPALARAATAIGIAGLFIETHPDPNKALSDGPNSIALRDIPQFIEEIIMIDRAVKKHEMLELRPRK
ncbi:MAG: 3-deoxy-8-phosphooctulonate synthase [Elusimicrobia bacterium]|nr:3-deoxy-8-phosphooctulonate synthase [Elusimicrobiota bacterium]